jgi:hypothetical protein
MIANAFFLTTVLFLAGGLFLVGEFKFLTPYRGLIYHVYAGPIAVYCALLFFNLFALVYFATRQLLLKDTGRKLAHVEKQLRTGSSISDELTKRLVD